MNEEQKAQALALRKITAVRDSDVKVTYVPERVGRQSWSTPVPNLADETGAVEGVLHRVLEKLVGSDVVLDQTVAGRPRQWFARWSGMGATEAPMHPTRLEAIVAALLALEVKP